MKFRLFAIFIAVVLFATIPIYLVWNFIFHSDPTIAPHYYQCVRHHFLFIETPCTTMPKPLAVIVSMIVLMSMITFAMRSENYLTKKRKYK